MAMNIVDLPYFDSVPIILNGEITADVASGVFSYNGRPVSFTPREELTDNTLYIITSFSFSADLDELIYQNAILKTPEINLWTTGEARTPLIRKPVFGTKYFDAINFMQPFLPQKFPNEILFSAKGVIDQNADIVALGKSALTLKVILTMYEVVNDEYIAQFKKCGRSLL